MSQLKSRLGRTQGGMSAAVADPSGSSMSWLFHTKSPIGMIWRHRELISQLVRRELTQRYKGSYLGVLWSYVTPLAMLAIYTLVFSVVLKVQWDVGPQDSAAGSFALVLFAGLIPFTVFSDVVSQSPNLILAVPSYVKKVVFPLEVLPVVIVCAAIIQSLISVAILVVAALAVTGSIPATIVLLPLAYLPLVFLCLAAGWLLSALGVYLRDLRQAIPILVQVLLFLSCLFYPVSAVPQSLRFLLFLHPLTVILYSFRRAAVWGTSLEWVPWAEWTAITFALAIAGWALFIRIKPGFADAI